MKRIQAKKHKIGTYEIDKISLSCFHDKRYVLDDGIHTLAYFHKDCNNRKKIAMIKKIAIIEKNKVVVYFCTCLTWCERRNWEASMTELTVIFNPSYVCHDMIIFWPASFVKFPWSCWTEFSQSWKDLRTALQCHENLQSVTDLSGANIGFNNKFKRLVILNVHVKNQSINEQKRVVLARFVHRILYLYKTIAEMQFQSMNISLPHVYREYWPLPELYI